MNIFDLIKDRYSVRKFEDKEIEKDVLDKILDVAKYTPTAVNSQPQKIYVLKSKESLKKISKLSPCIYGAPVVLMFCYDKNIAFERRTDPGHDFGEIDTTICCDQITLAAWSLGVGSCWVGLFDPYKVAKEFCLPETEKVVALLPIGYIAKDSKPHPTKHFESKNINQIVKEL